MEAICQSGVNLRAGRKQEVTDNVGLVWHLQKAFGLPPHFA